MERYNGCVNWFNSKKGYGFIDVHNNPTVNDTKLFCHQTNIKCKQDRTFRKLYPGEYVSFRINNTDKGFEALDIKGIDEGDLLVDNLNHIYKIYPKVPTDSHDESQDDLNSPGGEGD